MNVMMTNFIDTFLVDEQFECTKETNESTMTFSVWNLVKTFGIIYNVDKQSVDELTMSEALP